MVGDEAELYRRLAARVHAVVRRQITGSEQLIEGACHTAWVKFIERSEQINRQGTLSWLVRTAIHDAYKLSNREHRNLSLDGPRGAFEEPSTGATRIPSSTPSAASASHSLNGSQNANSGCFGRRRADSAMSSSLRPAVTADAPSNDNCSARTQNYDSSTIAGKPQPLIHPTGPLSIAPLGPPRLGSNTQPKRLQRP